MYDRFPIDFSNYNQDWVSNIVQVKSTHRHPALLEMKVTGEASLIMEKLDPETVISHLITFLRATNKNSIVPLPLFFHRFVFSCTCIVHYSK